MDLHRFFEISSPHVLERADLDDAGVIDQDINPAETIHDRLNRA
jgi:hypothetical protein